tara:strand:- start:2945 stop:3892 length:948 start_codon:yes stop_codon:yes gene_type:complete
MYRNHKICAIIPVYNEQKQIKNVINELPDFFDQIIVIDDKSEDLTVSIIEQAQKSNEKIILIKKKIREGAGSAKKEGYLFARKTSNDIFVTLDGDGQMDNNEVVDLIDPIIEDRYDFTKANRLSHIEVFKNMPKHRFLGNSILTLFTKIASGYWHVTDTQTGFTACNRKVLESLPFEKLYHSYGYPNHLLVMLNIYNHRVGDIQSKPIYNVGEKSHINIFTVGFKIFWLLLKSFFWRLKEKFIIRDFHPLVFFYLFGIMFLLLSILLSFRLIFVWYDRGSIPSINALAAMFSFVSSSIFILFAMWFDMDYNKDLK